MERYQVECVAVKLPDVFPTTKGFNQLIGTLNLLCEDKEIRVKYFTLSELKQAYTGNENTNISELIETIVVKNPELMSEYRKEQTNLNTYYQKVFEAVAVAQLK